MPATEQTWRDQRLLHRVFGVVGIVLLLSTIWMFAADHSRAWKPYQRKANDIELRMIDWREIQYETEEQVGKHEQLANELAATQAAALPVELIDRFKQVVLANPATENYSFASLDSSVQDLAAMAAQTPSDADEKSRQLTRQTRTRSAVLEEMRAIIRKARFNEDKLLGDRKFKSADRDEAVAQLGLLLRDGKSQAEKDAKQAEIDQLKAELDDLTLRYEAAKAHRVQLADVLKALTAAEESAQKSLETVTADLTMLATAHADRRSTYFTWWNGVPIPGKRWLELPILDAFNSPRKVENLWSAGLEIDYNFRKVRRFDRCTTCHNLIEKTQVGTADQPAYVGERLVDLVLPAPDSAALEALAQTIAGRSQRDENPLSAQEQVQELYGLRFAAEGLVNPDDITIQFVKPQSIAAQATALSDQGGETQLEGTAVREMLAAGTGDFARSRPKPGFTVGDVIVFVNGDPIVQAERTFFRLLDEADAGRTVTVTVRRGLPNPFTSHPRLDLFVGSLSPHKLSEFACTICHEGQGSATDFKWASHSPNDENQRDNWRREHGWFDNPHWIYPMYPARFAESSCLKCHHDIVELAKSERFPETPAPKLMHGYDLIRKYGCYTCHEVHGFDGDRRIGPDMRLEPNVFAAAQQLQTDPGFEALPAEAQDWARQLVLHPDRNEVRGRLYEVLVADQKAEQPKFSEDTHAQLTPLFAEVEHPGEYRKVGPSLRFVDSKLQPSFLYSWIREPKNFRPSTRMPQIFGLWDHLQGTEGEKVAQRYEPIEILGITTYLLKRSQKFQYLDQVAGAESASVERGRVLFETRGCLACHNHSKFADTAVYRDPDDLVQGPDLSRVADKFNHPNGDKWLYTWLRQPNSYHARTVMPDVMLTPIRNAETGQVTDPAADIVAYLLSPESSEGWKPEGDAIAEALVQNDLSSQANDSDLNAVMAEYLQDAFAQAMVAEYGSKGIPAAMRRELKGAERELVVSDELRNDPSFRLSAEQKLIYIGRKTIAKHGCYGCHDIPGFEDAKPVGTALTDWGRKDPAKLAFEHVVHYIEHHGHGSAGDAHASHGSGVGHDEGMALGGDAPIAKNPNVHDDADPATRDYYVNQVESGHRAGFIYQKLLEPRSYDYEKTQNKKYNERLRMPKFPFTSKEREAVITFVLGLVADPPSPGYVYKPDVRNAALTEGKKVLETYNCGGCHMLESEQWTISYRPGTFEPQPISKTYPFLQSHVNQQLLQASQNTDASGRMRATVAGMPSVGDADGLPVAYDSEGDPIEEDGQYDPATLEYPFDLWRPAILEGNIYEVGVLPLNLTADAVENRAPSDGGFLAKYLLPRVTEREKQINPAAKGTEAWGWLPPPLVGEGLKVQPEWLHNFLLDPYPIRPATVLRMPRFLMSPAEATALVNYFAAKDNAEYPYEYTERRTEWHVADANRNYQAAAGEARTRFGDAMKIVTDKNYCIKCHIVGDYVPAGADIAKAPNLAQIYRRLRPEYLRDWIANPKTKLPYTSMPVNIPYDADSPTLGGVSQDLYHGTSIDQLDALVDLLMNFDSYASQEKSVNELVNGVSEGSGTAGSSPSAPAAEPAAAPVPAPAAAVPAPAPAVAATAPSTAAVVSPKPATTELPDSLKNLPAATGWGDLQVRFLYGGVAPSSAEVNVTKDVEYCGPFGLTDDSLIVNPANGGLANVVGFLYQARGASPMPIHEDYLKQARSVVRVDNKQCRFEPHVALLWTPQTLLVGNLDLVGHNTKIDSFANPASNNTIPAGGQLQMEFSQPERLPAQVTCSIHPWMKSWLLVRDNPYSAVSTADGVLTVKNMPAGTWTFQFWHEKSGYVAKVARDDQTLEWNRGRVEVVIEAGKTTNLGTYQVPAELFQQ